MLARKQALSVTEAAAQRIQALLAKRGKPSVGVRVGVRSRGCSGLSYTLEYADEKGKYDEVVEDKGVTILVDPWPSRFPSSRSCSSSGPKWITSKRSCRMASPSAIPTRRGVAAAVNPSTSSESRMIA